MMDAVGNRKIRVVVIDMQPITPAVGGGRQRLLGLYHALGPNIDCTYVGSYDWPGEAYRDQSLTPGLREIVVPLSDAHHQAAKALSEKVGGRTVIDIAFADQVALSPEFLRVAREHIRSADVVVFSHPWCFPPLADALGKGQLVIYDSQNVEAILRFSLHGDVPAMEPLLARVVEVERDLCHRADLVLACSHGDRETFHRVYDVPWFKLRIAPNGIFAFNHLPPDPQERSEAKHRLAVKARVLAIFLGSNYGPNNDAAAFVNARLAPAFPELEFAIIGGSGSVLEPDALAPNVRVLGILGEDLKRRWMDAADIAVNPLKSGSGTSIKMFDFMAARLPVVTTDVGARGIVANGSPPFVIADLDHMVDALRSLLGDQGARSTLASNARSIVEDFYAWERISPTLGRLLTGRLRLKSHARPFFTVVIPSYERPRRLDTLMRKLEAQWERDFEVIVVDQSAKPWPNAARSHRFPLRYVHSEIRGAVPARNLGAALAAGKVIAFTDDDCEPKPDWLVNARSRFSDSGVVGVEGIIRSDHLHEPDWRPVTNVGFEGIGFMTANLMVRGDVFQRLNGFDRAFDRPHFREDTDFGWRMQTLGRVPYAADVEVFHPAQRRDNQRESRQQRNLFFEKDAILLKKHPEKYRTLFAMEAHYLVTAGFWENLQRGLEKYLVTMPEWMAELQIQCSATAGKQNDPVL